MQQKISKFWSHIIIALSTKLFQLKKTSFYRIKLKSVATTIKKKDRLQTDLKYSSKNNNNLQSQYCSITDFKPLNSLYSSVKLHQDDFLTNKYQTKKHPSTPISKQQSHTCILQDWMIAKKAQTIPVQQYDQVQFSKKPILSYSQNAIQLIKAHQFDQYCQQTIKKTNNILFFKQNANPLKYKKDSISQSLTHLSDTKIQISLDIFQLLLKIGGQKNDQFPIIFTIWKYIKIIFQQTQDIKQQSYLQLIKQWSSKKKIYLQLLACMSAIIQPPTRMYLPLLNFILTQSQDLNLIQYRPYFNFIFFSLIKNFSTPCQVSPSIPQLYCLLNLKKIPILINFPRENIFFIQFYSTVEQLLQQLISLYGLNKNTEYILSMQNVPMMTGSILDGYNRNKKDYDEQDIWQKFLNYRGYRVCIVIKNMMQMYKNEQNFLIMFNYCINQYRRGLFPLNKQTIFQIGGLIIASQIQIQDHYQYNLSKYLPIDKYKNGLLQSKIQKLQQILIQQYFKFQGTKMQARKKIIQKFSKCIGFRTHFFYCNIFIDDCEYESGWVGIKAQSLFIIQRNASRLMFQIQYQDIYQWGSSSTQLCLKINDIGDLHLQCSTLDVMIQIFTNYLTYLKNNLQP